MFLGIPQHVPRDWSNSEIGGMQFLDKTPLTSSGRTKAIGNMPVNSDKNSIFSFFVKSPASLYVARIDVNASDAILFFFLSSCTDLLKDDEYDALIPLK